MLTFSLTLFTAVALGSYTVLRVMFGEERAVSRVLQQVPAYEADQMQQAEPLLRPFYDRVLRPVGQSLLRGLRSLGLRELRAKLRFEVVQAGNPGGMDGDVFLVLQGIVVFVVVLQYGVLLALRPSTSMAVGALAFSAIVVLAPYGLLRMAIDRRKKAIRKALPEMLDMLTISVQAGLGFDASLAKLVRNSTGPLPQEFARMLQQVQAGVARKDAMKSMAERIDVPELNAFIMAMVQADVFGISVSNVLTTQAQEIRLRRRQHAEEVAQKAPVKIVFPVVVCILPASLLVVAGPAVIAIGQAFGMMGK
jgi:tight adherence protein C